MKIELTASNGETYTFKQTIKNGDYIKVVYTNETGEELSYFMRITPKGRVVLN